MTFQKMFALKEHSLLLSLFMPCTCAYHRQPVMCSKRVQVGVVEVYVCCMKEAVQAHAPGLICKIILGSPLVAHQQVLSPTICKHQALKPYRQNDEAPACVQPERRTADRLSEHGSHTPAEEPTPDRPAEAAQPLREPERQSSGAPPYRARLAEAADPLLEPERPSSGAPPPARVRAAATSTRTPSNSGYTTPTAGVSPHKSVPRHPSAVNPLHHLLDPSTLIALPKIQVLQNQGFLVLCQRPIP